MSNSASRFALRCYRVRAVLLALLCWTPAAMADTRMPVSFVQRPLSLSQGTLRIDGGPRWPFPSHQLRYNINPGPNGFAFAGGVTYGFSSDFQAGAVVPLDLAEDIRVLDPTLHALYRFVSGDVQVGGFASLDAPIDSDRFSLTLGVPVEVALGSAVRLDTGGFFQMRSEPWDAALIVPVILPIQVSRATHVGPETGLTLPDLKFDDPVFRLGAFIGYSLAPDGPLLGDLTARVVFPNVDNMDAIAITAGADLYFDL